MQPSQSTRNRSRLRNSVHQPSQHNAFVILLVLVTSANSQPTSADQTQMEPSLLPQATPVLLPLPHSAYPATLLAKPHPSRYRRWFAPASAYLAKHPLHWRHAHADIEEVRQRSATPSGDLRHCCVRQPSPSSHLGNIRASLCRPPSSPPDYPPVHDLAEAGGSRRVTHTANPARASAFVALLWTYYSVTMTALGPGSLLLVNAEGGSDP